MTAYRERLLAGVHTDGGETETVQVEEPQPQNGFVCDECGQTFDTQHGLAIHQGKAHQPEEVPA